MTGMTGNQSGGESRNPPPLLTRIRVPERVLMRQVGEEMVMLNLDEENYYGLNAVGARLMQIAENGATLEHIVEQLLTEFDVARAQLEIDVRQISAELIAIGLLDEDSAR